MSELGLFAHELEEAYGHLRNAVAILKYEWEDAANEDWTAGRIGLALMRQVMWLVNRIRKVLGDDIVEAQLSDRHDHSDYL